MFLAQPPTENPASQKHDVIERSAVPPNVPTGRGLELAACVAPTDGGHHHAVSDVQKYLTVALGAHWEPLLEAARGQRGGLFFVLDIVKMNKRKKK